jgi:hypothetical protein
VAPADASADQPSEVRREVTDVSTSRFGFASLRARVFPASACVAVMITAVVGYFAAMPPFGAPLGLAVAWLGISMIRARASQHASEPVSPAVARIG